ncbi:unnamed protein product [Arctogadus glacialis]
METNLFTRAQIIVVFTHWSKTPTLHSKNYQHNASMRVQAMHSKAILVPQSSPKKNAVLCRLTSHPLKVNVTTCTLQRLQMINQA